MNKVYCHSCQHYIQHYALRDGRLIQVCYGHCVYANPKAKRPDQKACEYFVQGVKDTEQFVSNEYLSKKLLDKVLSMELLPKIEDLPV